MTQFYSGLEKQSITSRALRQAFCGMWIVLGTLFTSTLYAQSAPASGSTTFLIVRHAERDGNLDKLTTAGKQRAQLLASVGAALNVQAIYSTDTERTKGTVQPLAEAANTEIQIYGRPTENWITALKQKHVGQVVLIVGHSNTAGLIAGLLAKEKPFGIAHDEYDSLFIIQTSDTQTRAMRLRYGNATHGASSADPDKMGEIDLPRTKK